MQRKIDELANRAVAELKSLGDPTRAEGEARYFKNTITCLGTGLDAIHRTKTSLCKNITKTWTPAEAIALCDKLFEMKLFEVTLFGLEFLSDFAGKMGAAELAHFEQWLESDLIDNWAATDNLGPHVIGPMLEKHPELVERIKQWPASRNRWTRRTSAVSFVLLARKGLFLDDVYEIAGMLIADKEDDLVQQGVGWVMREAGRTDMDRLERFLLANGPNIPRTSLRYAIEKYPPEKRKQLLAATKAKN